MHLPAPLRDGITLIGIGGVCFAGFVLLARLSISLTGLWYLPSLVMIGLLLLLSIAATLGGISTIKIWYRRRLAARRVVTY